jgi:hypothetical protein
MMQKLAKPKLHPLGVYFAKKVPGNWLDPLLTGPDAVIGKPPYDCKDIECLLNAVADRIRRSRTRTTSNRRAEHE